MAVAESGGHAVKKGEGPSGGRSLTENLLNGDQFLGGDTGAVFPGPKLHTSPFGEACAVNYEIINNFAHCAAMEAVEEVELRGNLAVDS